MPRRVLFFDFDGTLIDSMPHHAAIFGQLLADAYGLDPGSSAASYLAQAGKPLEAQFRHGLEQGGIEAGEQVGALIDEFWRRYEALEPVVFPDVPAELPALAGAHSLVVTTQGRQRLVQAKLRRLGLDRHFALVLGVDPARPELGKGAPHFRLAAEALSLAPADLQASVMTGDGAFDMQVAREAGMTAVGRLTGDNADVLRAAGAHFVVHDLHELAAWLGDD
jgi:phosphoglycolate phosphatase-like HAD superfamily hydrolase